MRKKKIAMFLAMALTLTQSVGMTVSVAAEELEIDAGQEEVFQDDSDAETTVDEETASGEEVSIQEEADETQDETVPVTEEEISEYTDGIEVFGDSSEGLSTFSADAAEKQYVIGTMFQGDGGTQSVLPNGTIRIHIYLSESVDGENWEETSDDYTLELPPVDTEYKDMADYAIDGKEIIVNAHNKTGPVDFPVNVLIDGKVVCTERLHLDINRYVIFPENVPEEISNLAEGQQLDIAKDLKPSLVYYDENDKQETVQDCKIVLDGYDEEGGWSCEDEEAELPVLTRTTGDSTWIRLVARIKDDTGEWREVAGRNYSFEELPGNNGDGDDGDNGGDGDHNDDSESRSPYELSIHYVDTTGNGAMLPNSKLTIETDLRDKTGGLNPVTDYRLEIVEQPEVAKVTVAADGKTLLAESGDATGDAYCYVSVQVPDQNGDYKEAFRKDIWFEVSEFVLTPSILDDGSGNMINPAVGETVNVARFGVKLVRYINGQGEPVDVDSDDIRIVVASWWDDETGEERDYDSWTWDLKDVEGQELPFMTRKTGDSTWIALTALWRNEDGDWEQIARKSYDIDPTDRQHSHTWDAGIVLEEATCKTAGSKFYKCTGCDATKTEKIPAKSHTIVKDNAIKATVFKAGKTEGKHCKVCGTVITKQNTIAKLTPKISLTASSLKMQTGQSATAFRAGGFAAGDYVTKVTSTNTNIVKVASVKRNGTFKLTAGRRTGNATVTVILASKKKAAFRVTVQRETVRTERVAVTVRNLTMTKATPVKLSPSVVVTPVTSRERVTYSSSNRNIVTVSSQGVVRAIRPGTTRITVRSGSKRAVVTVKVNAIRTTKLSGIPASKTVSRGKTFQIRAVAAPKNTDERIIYASSNGKIATVTSGGVVKGLRKGTATITVKSGSKKMTCKVTVK